MYPPLVCWGAKPGLRGIKSGTYEASSPACDGHLHTHLILLILPQFPRAVRKFWLNLLRGRSRGGRQGRQAEPAPGCCRGFHRRLSAAIDWSGRSLCFCVAPHSASHVSASTLATRVAVLLGRAREGRSPLEFKSSPATCAVDAGNFSGRDSERVPFISKTYLH